MRTWNTTFAPPSRGRRATARDDAKGEALAVAEPPQDPAGASPLPPEHAAARTGAGRCHREREIAHVLTRHGLHFLAATVGLAPHGGQGDPELEHSGAATVQARELRVALEELGPTFIKLGQLMSRAQRLGNRIALSVLAAALIDAGTELLGGSVTAGTAAWLVCGSSEHAGWRSGAAGGLVEFGGASGTGR
jgi:hypothetical protein